MADVQVTSHWNGLLDAFPLEQHDVYYTEQYARLYTGDEVEAKAFARIEGDDVFLVPYLAHTNKYAGGANFDLSTPYGYGGPISTTDDTRFIHDSQRAFFDTMREAGAVSGFVRCHPLLGSHTRLGERWDVRFDRMTVGADLSLSEEELWSCALNTKGRNRVRHAESSGVEIVIDSDLELLDDFVNVYYHAMDAVSAAPFYYFSRGYFDAIKRDLREEACIIGATVDGELVAGMLMLYDHAFAHGHLSGSLVEYRELAPNNLVIYRAMLEAKGRGCRAFHLGGGASNKPDDSLYRFKRCFSRDRYSFYVASAVFDSEGYARAMMAWLTEQQPDLEAAVAQFPPYGLVGPAA